VVCGELKYERAETTKYIPEKYFVILFLMRSDWTMDMAENNRIAMSAFKKVHVIKKPWSRSPLLKYFARSSSYRIRHLFSNITSILPMKQIIAFMFCKNSY
jgi:hypothetical protein